MSRRTVLISGASRGIGRAIAERLVADGHRISLGLRNPTSLGGTSLATDQVFSHRYDAFEPDSATRWVDATVARWGGFDTLIHCAGILRTTPLLFEDGEEKELDDLWRVNVMGPWWLTRAAWTQLEISGNSRIQVLVSMSGKRVKGKMAGYPVSKFALMALCQSMRNQGWNQGIRVTAICPSWVSTDMAASTSTFDPDAMTHPRDLASLSSTLLQLPNQSVPFEISLNCSFEA